MRIGKVINILERRRTWLLKRADERTTVAVLDWDLQEASALERAIESLRKERREILAAAERQHETA